MSKIYEALTKFQREGEVLNNKSKSTPVTNGKPEVRPTDSVRLSANQIALEFSSEESAPILVGDGRPAGKAADEFRVLSLLVRDLTIQKGNTVLNICSALRGEGKSFVALNLAIGLARLGVRVLLVDADLRQPTLQECFARKPLHGLTSYLGETADLETCIYNTALPTMCVVPAGGAARSAAELVGGAAMGRFMAAAKELYHDGIVIVDGPPLLAASEARILASLADAILMVVLADHTPRSAVTRALDAVKERPVVGWVLNRFEPAFSQKKMEYRYSNGA